MAITWTALPPHPNGLLLTPSESFKRQQTINQKQSLPHRSEPSTVHQQLAERFVFSGVWADRQTDTDLYLCYSQPRAASSRHTPPQLSAIEYRALHPSSGWKNKLLPESVVGRGGPGIYTHTIYTVRLPNKSNLCQYCSVDACSGFTKADFIAGELGNGYSRRYECLFAA